MIPLANSSSISLQLGFQQRGFVVVSRRKAGSLVTADSAWVSREFLLDIAFLVFQLFLFQLNKFFTRRLFFRRLSL